MVQNNSSAAPTPLTADCLAALSAARHGSSAALGMLLELFRVELLELADGELGAKIGSKTSASDIVQEALLDAVADFSQFDGMTGEDLRAWLRQIVHHRSVDAGRWYRQSEKRDLARERPISDRLEAELATPDPSPSAQLALDETAQRLRDAVSNLPEPHRTILWLRHRDGKTFDEIGAHLDCSPFRARRAWCHALLMLQRELKERT